MTELRDPAEVFATKIGWQPALERTDLLAEPVAAALRALGAASPEGTDLARQAQVIPIDPSYSDTDVLNAHYDLNPKATRGCVLVAGKRTGEERIAACVVRATDSADVSHVVKKCIDMRKALFLPVERVVEMSSMEYGGITPVDLPKDWRLFIDDAVADWTTVLIGSGVRHSKLPVPGVLLVVLPGAEHVEGLGVRPAWADLSHRPGGASPRALSPGSPERC